MSCFFAHPLATFTTYTNPKLDRLPDNLGMGASSFHAKTPLNNCSISGGQDDRYNFPPTVRINPKTDFLSVEMIPDKKAFSCLPAFYDLMPY
jgi:hypothetical protein